MNVSKAVPLFALLPLACSTTSGEPSSATTAQGLACSSASVIVASTDTEYTSSDLGRLSLDGGQTFFSMTCPLCRDPVLASSGGRVFYIDRDDDQVIELDPRCAIPIHGPWTTTDDPDAGNGSNPQDVAVDPTTGNVWVARFGVPSILVKSNDGSSTVGHVDLSMVTGTSRNPYMSSIRIIDLGQGPKAYVALEMLDAAEQSTGPSYLVRLDVATALETGNVEAMLELQGRNPFGLIVEDGTSLYLADLGKVDAGGETNAGVERVDLTTFTSTMLLTEEAIGAKVDQVSVSGGCGTAIVMAAVTPNITSVVSFSLDGGRIVTPYSQSFLLTDAGFELAGMAWLDGGINLVGDRTQVAKQSFPVHVLSASAGCELTEERPLFVPLGPVALAPVP